MNLVDVVGEFLADLGESDLYLPFFGLLLAEGFTDVHQTHGSAEFGKDFIAKRDGDEGVEQWCFQLKAGNISQTAWRNEVQNQLFEAATSGIGHPSFDPNLKRRIVLVATGRLVGNAPVAMQSFNADVLQRKLGVEALEVWDLDHLKGRFAANALGSLVTQAHGPRESGPLLEIFGVTLQGGGTTTDIERHSRAWLGPNVESRPAMFMAVFESALLASAFRRHGRWYEEVHCYMAVVRAAMSHATENVGDDRLHSITRFALRSIASACARGTLQIAQTWRENDRNALHAFASCIAGPPHYLALCSRISECAALVVLLSDNEDEREAALVFLREWFEHEPGATRPLSDRYGVSVLWALLALWSRGAVEPAKSVLRRAVFWLCDRYEDASHLAGPHATPAEETRVLLGQAFDFVDLGERRQSVAACGLADFAAFTRDPDLYFDVVNDIKAVGICPEYVQATDHADQFRVDGQRLLRYVNVVFADQLGPEGAPYADHVAHEPASFLAAEVLTPRAYVALSLLLRDRYFPSLWARIAAA